jgi:hypothetical protein
MHSQTACQHNGRSVGSANWAKRKVGKRIAGKRTLFEVLTLERLAGRLSCRTARAHVEERHMAGVVHAIQPCSTSTHPGPAVAVHEFPLVAHRSAALTRQVSDSSFATQSLSIATAARPRGESAHARRGTARINKPRRAPAAGDGPHADRHLPTRVALRVVRGARPQASHPSSALRGGAAGRGQPEESRRGRCRVRVALRRALRAGKACTWTLQGERSALPRSHRPRLPTSHFPPQLITYFDLSY